jgi:hypothetical protein
VYRAERVHLQGVLCCAVLLPLPALPEGGREMADSSRLSRKLQSLLEMPTESPELVTALDLLGGMYGANTADARRGLRGLLETEHLNINQQLIDAFGPAQQQLAAVTAQVEALTRSCDEIGESIQTAKQQTRELLADSERLVHDKQRLEVQQSAVGNFLERFQLTPEEEEALQRGEVDAQFLEALARLARIRADCGQLLRTRHQRAALELMDVMGAHQESAFEHLYRWVQSAVKDLSEESAEEDGEGFIARAVLALRERPVLFKYCVEEMGKSRRVTVLNNFLCALTQGGPNGMPRPIELSAGEPLRYVGDMASWLHQALANEAEMLRQVLGEAADIEGGTPKNSPRAADGCDDAKAPTVVGKEGTEGAASSDVQAAAEASEGSTGLWQRVLGSAFQSVCRPFKLRVEQALANNSDGVLSYQLANLLAFYAETVEHMLPGSELAATMRVTEEQCSKSVFETWSVQHEDLLASPPPCPSDLGISSAIETAASRLASVCDACSESLVSARQTDAEFGPVLAGAIEAPLRVCYLSGANAQLDESSLAIFLINNLSRLEASMRPYRQSFTRTRTEEVAAQIAANIETLVSAQVSHILSACGLAVQYRAMKVNEGSDSGLSTVAGCSEPEMAESLRTFYAQLFATGDDTDAGSATGSTGTGGAGKSGGGGSGKIFSACAKIQAPRTRESARAAIVSATLSCYSELYAAVHDKSNGYLQPATLAPHGPEAVRMVLE